MSEGEYLKRYERVQSERQRFSEWLKANHTDWTFAQQHAAWQAWRQCTLDVQPKATA
jgi:hypothetical protein